MDTLVANVPPSDYLAASRVALFSSCTALPPDGSKVIAKDTMMHKPGAQGS